MWSIAALLKFLYESKLLATSAGVAALLLIGYIEVFQLPAIEAQVSGVQESVGALQLASLEERLDAAYTALCMNPGDPAILERIRELQQQYRQITDGKVYDPPSCDLLIKLK
jgi:hypothetical protein